MKKRYDLKNKDDFLPILTLCLCVTAALLVIWSFTGQWPWKDNPYNSYALQVRSWLDGRLDIDNREYLELAIFNNKYFVSFPPFPSYVMLPFALIFGGRIPEGFIAFAFALIGAVYTYKLVRGFGKTESASVFWTLFTALGTNVLFCSVTPWVWFIAQNMCFALLVMSLYYAGIGKGGVSLAAWAFAVGCRPFSALYIFIIAYLLYKNLKEKYPDKGIAALILSRWKWCIAPLAIALSYMILNYARFGNPVEFGHNYLPEFMRVETGQFSGAYLRENIKNLFRLPTIGDNGRLEFPTANGFCLFIVSPLFITYVIYSIRALVKREKPDYIAMAVTAATIIIELLCIAAHKTMGGSHFGNRYTNDVLPLALLGALLCPLKNERGDFLNTPLLFLGFALNLAGTIMYYMS